jgi:hypothetical protein
MKYNIIDENLVTDIYNSYIAHRNRNKLNPKIGRPPTIDVKHVIRIMFKILKGNRMEDLIDDQTKLSSYEKIGRDIRRFGLLNNIMKNKLGDANSAGLIDTSSVHIDSSLSINKCGEQEVKYSYKFKNKKGTSIHLSLSNNYFPLGAHVKAANIPDVVQLEKTMDNIMIPLLSSNKKPVYINADTGYNSLKNFNLIEHKYKLKLLCPVKKNAKMKHPHNKTLFNRMKRKHNQIRYKNRLKIERFFATIKSFAKINMRTDKLADVFLGSIQFVLLNIIYKTVKKIIDIV